MPSFFVLLPTMNTPFIDIHTHDATPKDDVLKIVNLGIEETCPQQGSFSFGIHPWDLDSADFQLEEAVSRLKERLELPQVIALGEAGLDKMHPASYERQTLAFGQQIMISETMRKPLIIHDVRSHNEVIALRKKHHARQAWILHGFNGTEQDIQQLTSQGIYLSVGEALLHPERKICKAIKTINLDFLFLETDTAEIEIEKIYEKTAVLLEMPLDALKERIFCNFARIFN